MVNSSIIWYNGAFAIKSLGSSVISELMSLGTTNTKIIVNNIRNDGYSHDELVDIVKRYPWFVSYIKDNDQRILIKLLAEI